MVTFWLFQMVRRDQFEPTRKLLSKQKKSHYRSPSTVPFRPRIVLRSPLPPISPPPAPPPPPSPRPGGAPGGGRGVCVRQRDDRVCGDRAPPPSPHVIYVTVGRRVSPPPLFSPIGPKAYCPQRLIPQCSIPITTARCRMAA